MIIIRYLSKQILQVTVAITFLLLVVVVLGRLVKYLAQASQGDLDSSVLILLMSYRMPEFVQLILPLALLLGILLAYGRMYADNEMTVFLACGLSKLKILGVTLVSSILIAILVGVLAMKLTPCGLVKAQTLLEAQKELNEFDVMVPGIFQDISQGSRTTYTESIVDEKMHNVFMYENEANRITAAQTASMIDGEEKGRFVLFKEGTLTEGVTGDKEMRLTYYSEFGIRVPQRTINFEITVEEAAMNTSALLGSNETARIAELQWRISLILLIPILTIMAVPLSKVSPRQGRFAKLFPAILVYIVYFGLLLGSRDMLAEGALSPVLGLWWVHILFLGLGLLLFFEKLPPLGKLRFRKANA